MIADDQHQADKKPQPAARPPLDLRIAADVSEYLTRVQAVLAALPREPLALLTEALVRAGVEGRTIFALGNGGSAATASHLACDLAKTAAVVGAASLRVMALTDNVPLMTAVANDIGYEQVFAQQLRIFARPGDIAIIFSASGSSPNIVRAAEAAHELGVTVVGITGFGGGKLQQVSDLSLVVASSEYGPVEDVHMIVAHALTAAVRATTQRAQTFPQTLTPEPHLTPDLLSGATCETAAGQADHFPHEAGAPLTVFLDRDGVINRNSDDYVKRWDEFEFLPGAVEALARLRRAGHRVFVVTNQACIAKGLTSTGEVELVHQRMRTEVARAGGFIEGILVCPHHPQDQCACRKPEPGLLWQACDQYGVDLARAVVIGDGATDIELAQRAGIPAMLVLTGLGWRTASVLSPRRLRACRVALSLDHAVRMLLDDGATEDEAALRALVRRARAGQWAAVRHESRVSLASVGAARRG